MAERRNYSRAARKQLGAKERSRLISEMLGADDGTNNDTDNEKAGRKSPNKTTEFSFEALEALDAEFDEELSIIRAEEASERALEETREHDALVDEAIEQLSEECISNQEPVIAATPTPREPKRRAETDTHNKTKPLPLGSASPPAPVYTEVTPGESEAGEHSADELAHETSGSSPTDTPVQEKLRAAYETANIETQQEPADLWNKLAVMPVDVLHLEENLVITASRNEPAHGAFDVLRTRLVQTLLEHGWKRVAITSPTRNCGKTFTAVNLAISLSRYEANRTILLDMDMRNPSVADVIGDPNPGCMADFLRGVTSAEDFLVKFDKNNLNIGPNLAIGTNGVIEPYAAELAQDPATGKNLDRMMQEMSPDIVLFDMPPALAFDDVIAFRKHFDGVLMVVGGGSTSPEEVREVMRRLGEETPLLGVVLNQAEGEDGSDYSYGY